MDAKIKILEVQIVNGFIHPNSVHAYDANKYNANKNVHRKPIPKALKIKAVAGNEQILNFYSPTIIKNRC